MTSIQSPRQRRKEARPAEIISAALTIFHSKGFAASKIEDVAQAAGVTKGTVYLYFPSKEALFKAVIHETISPNLDRIEEVAKTGATARAQLRTALQMWSNGIHTCRGSMTKLMIAEAGNFPELADFFQEEISERLRRIMVRIIEFGIAQGEFRDCDPVTVFRALSAPVLLGDVWQRTFPQTNQTQSDPALLIDSLLDVVLNGISQRTEAHE